MKLEQYKILNNTLVLKFDRKFKQIRLLKLELIDESKVETDNVEMRFSKEKDEIILFMRDSMVFVMLYINMIDNEECSDGYYIRNDKCDIMEGWGQVGMEGIGVLIKSKAGDFFSSKVEGVEKRVCLINSENIFAEINRRCDKEIGEGIRSN
jgi:hypothetical protein